MGNVTPNEASKAFRLRRKLKAGKQLDADETEWLRAYESRVASPVRLLPAPQQYTDAVGRPPMPEEQSEIQIVSPNVATAYRNESPGETPPPIDVQLSSDNQEETEEPSNSESSSPKNAKPKTEPVPEYTAEQRAQGTAVADKLVGYLKECNSQLEAVGGTPVPEMVFDLLVHPCASQLATKYAVSELVPTSDTACAIVVGAAAVATVGQLHVKRAQRAKADTGPNGQPAIDIKPNQVSSEKPKSRVKSDGPF